MEHDSQPETYYIHVWIRGIHPMLWRRFDLTASIEGAEHLGSNCLNAH